MKKQNILILLSLMFLFSYCNSNINDPKLPTGKVVIYSSPPAGKIFLSGIDTKKITPDSIHLDQGNYTITLKLKEYLDTTFNINVLYNFTTTSDIIFTSIFGKVFVNSEPTGAEIFLNGDNTGRLTPDTIYNILPGSNIFTLKKSPYPDTTFEINVQSGELENVSIFFLGMPNSNVSFSQHIYPVLKLNCATSECHDNETRAGGLALTSWAQTTADPIIVFPGEPDNSTLVWAIEARAGVAPMPPIGYDPLTQNQINGIKVWIAEGAKNN